MHKHSQISKSYPTFPRKPILPFHSTLQEGSLSHNSLFFYYTPSAPSEWNKISLLNCLFLTHFLQKAHLFKYSYKFAHSFMRSIYFFFSNAYLLAPTIAFFPSARCTHVFSILVIASKFTIKDL